MRGHGFVRLWFVCLLLVTFGLSLALVNHHTGAQSRSKPFAEAIAFPRVAQKGGFPFQLVEDAKSTSFTNDPLEFLNTSGKSPAGFLAYAADVPAVSQPTQEYASYLVWNTLGLPSPIRRTILCRVERPREGFCYDPNPSPDGKWLAFSFGHGLSDDGDHKLFLYNLATKRLYSGPTEVLTFSSVLWARDSQSLAYFQGGDASGEDSRFSGPLELYVYDVATRRSTFIARNPAARECDWTPGNALLYTEQPPIRGSAQDSESIPRNMRSSIYEAGLANPARKRLVPQAFMPRASPDGKWIAFLGWSDTGPYLNGEKTGGKQARTSQPDQFGLCVFHRATRARSLLIALPERSLGDRSLRPSIAWSADGKRLIVLQSEHTPKPEASTGGRYFEARITSIDVLSGRRREIAVIRSHDITHDIREPDFSLYDVSSDNKWVITEMAEHTGIDGKGYITSKVTVGTVFLPDKSLSTLARLNAAGGGLTGFEWQNSVPQQVH